MRFHPASARRGPLTFCRAQCIRWLFAGIEQHQLAVDFILLEITGDHTGALVMRRQSAVIADQHGGQNFLGILTIAISSSMRARCALPGQIVSLGIAPARVGHHSNSAFLPHDEPTKSTQPIEGSKVHPPGTTLTVTGHFGHLIAMEPNMLSSARLARLPAFFIQIDPLPGQQCTIVAHRFTINGSLEITSGFGALEKSFLAEAPNLPSPERGWILDRPRRPGFPCPGLHSTNPLPSRSPPQWFNLPKSLTWI